MTAVQELAHWRYRIGAIARELENLRKQEDLFRAEARRIRAIQARAASTAAEVRGVSASRRAEDDVADAVMPYIIANKYLLEEARYMVELKSVEVAP